MKTLSLIITAVLFQTILSAQAKFYTNNGSKEVTQVNCKVGDLKIVFAIPDEALNHDLLQVAIGEKRSDGSKYYSDWAHFKDFKADYLKGKKELSMWIKKPDSKYGDFAGDYWTQSGKTPYYPLCRECDSEERNYATMKVVIKLIGKDETGKVWENGKYKTTYGFTEIASHILEMDMGEVSPTVSGDNFVYTKFKGQAGYAHIDIDNDIDRLHISYNSNGSGDDHVVVDIDKIEKGKSNNSTFDMGGGMSSGGSASSEISVEGIKKTAATNLYINANPNFSSKVTKPEEGLFFGEYVYEPFISTKKKFVEKEIESLGNGLSWKSETIGSTEFQVLRIPVYEGKAWSTSANTGEFKMNPEYAGTSKEMILLVGEKNGNIFAGKIIKTLGSTYEGDEAAFVNHILKTLEVK